MRVIALLSAIIAALLIFTTTPEAQVYPFTFGLDSNVRIEYMFGQQIIAKGARNPNDAADGSDSFNEFRKDFEPRVPVLEGSIEISPFYLFSARGIGRFSVLESSQKQEVTTLSTGADFYHRPQFRSWEAAGLYHLFSGGGYRFSAVGGYRYSSWNYWAENTTNNLQSEFSSKVPFIGLQTNFISPLWKARFEILGSLFMKTYASHLVIVNPLVERHVLQFHGTADNGGLLELQFEGSAGISRNLWCGLYASYSHQELRGPGFLTNTNAVIDDPVRRTNHEIYVCEDFFNVGLNLNLMF